MKDFLYILIVFLMAMGVSMGAAEVFQHLSTLIK
jgi:hypothetical protein